MSDTTPASSRRGWDDARKRRAKMFAVLLLVCAAVALWATAQPWFAWATPGLVPNCDPAPAGGPTVSVEISRGVFVDGVAARGCYSGFDTVATYDLPAGANPGLAAALSQSDTLMTDTPAELLGAPRTTIVLLGVIALALVGVIAHRGWLLAGIPLLARFALEDLARTRQLFGPEVHGVEMASLGYYSWAMLAGIALSVIALCFVLKVNYDHRAKLREEAAANGEQDPAEPLDPMLSYLGRKVTKVKAAIREADRTPTSA